MASTATGWGLAGLAGFAILGAATPVRAMAFFLFMQVGSLGISFTFWSMLPDHGRIRPVAHQPCGPRHSSSVSASSS